MIAVIDHLLNRFTMYRITIWYLGTLIGIATILGLIGLLPFHGFALLVSTFLLIGTCWLTNRIFATVYGAPVVDESAYITGCILALIVSPLGTSTNLAFLIWSGILAIASKYILAIQKQHLFNPAAIGVAVAGFGLGQSASWWVGNPYLLPAVLIGGSLVIWKLRRWDVVLSFFLTAVATSLGAAFIKGSHPGTVLGELLVFTPFFFLASIMLTEPATLPATRPLRVLFGGLVGVLFTPQVHLGSLYFTPELALLAGNLLLYLLAPRERYELILKKKILVARNVYDFIFTSLKPIPFQAGQYFEWTLPHPNPDSRGSRRYFTIASAPHSREVRIGVKFTDQGSTYKQALRTLKPGDRIVASQLAGDFTLPKDPRQKCVFLAGGIGVTPFRSMLEELLFTKDQRSIILIYANRFFGDIAYQDLLARAKQELGIETLYTLLEPDSAPKDWVGHRGIVDAETVKTAVPDFSERLFYVSGSNQTVQNFISILKELGLSSRNIKTDYFPGF